MQTLNNVTNSSMSISDIKMHSLIFDIRSLSFQLDSIASPDKINWGGQVCKGVWGHPHQKKFFAITPFTSLQDVGNTLSSKKYFFYIAMSMHQFF